MIHRLIAFLERGNGGLRTLITIGGIVGSLVTGIFIAGGIWIDLRRSVQANTDQNHELLLEMRGLREDVQEVKEETGINAAFRRQYLLEREEQLKRFDRLEKFHWSR